MIEIVCGKEAEMKPAKVFKAQLTNEGGRTYLRVSCNGAYNYALIELKEVDGKLKLDRSNCFGIEVTNFHEDRGMILVS